MPTFDLAFLNVNNLYDIGAHVKRSSADQASLEEKIRGLAHTIRDLTPARMESAAQLGEFYNGTARIETDAMVLVGDFNCEPGDKPFRQTSPCKLRTARERGVVLRERNRLGYFYNLMARWLGEPDDYETARAEDYRPGRPMGTFCAGPALVGWNLWDQVLVTKPVITGPMVRIVERSLRAASARKQCSDHHAIAVTFEY